MNRNKKLANMAMLVALAMIFSYVESLIPINFGVRQELKMHQNRH